MKPIIITIGREFGSGGRLVAHRLSEVLHIPYYDREIIQAVAKQTGLSEQYIRTVDQRPTNSFIYDLYCAIQTPSIPDQVFIAQSKVIKEAAERGSCVIVGRCADYVLRDRDNLLRVFVTAPIDQRVRRAREVYQVEAANVEGYVIKQDKCRASYYNYFSTERWGDRSCYDLCVNSRIGIEQTVAVIQTAFQALQEEGTEKGAHSD
ncbi:MAG: cytidylate kinase-like family protein [Oscillospiraceae bacterium]|nr:cytidylate kinase-like family protein [Oscillospiraceae bacterium]